MRLTYTSPNAGRMDRKKPGIRGATVWLSFVQKDKMYLLRYKAGRWLPLWKGQKDNVGLLGADKKLSRSR
jgi:hypothetical protein